MKTTLYNNTIESLQTDEDWKLFLDSIVDDCHVVNDDNLLAETENGLVLLSDSQDDLQARYASLSYKRDLMRMNITENISLTSFLRMLSLYGAKIRETNKNTELPHTYLVQSSDKDTGVWGFNKANITDDHKAQTPDPDDPTTSIDVAASAPNESDNYFDEDTRYKYIYNVYGYNQKESVLYYSPMCHVREFYKFTNSEDLNNTYYIAVDEINKMEMSGNIWGGDWLISFTSENPRVWRSNGNASANPVVVSAYDDIMDIAYDTATNFMFVICNYLTPVLDNGNPVIEKRYISPDSNDYANLDTYVIIYDNKPDDVYKDGFIKFNHPDYGRETTNEKYLNRKTFVVESGDFVCTNVTIGTGHNQMYIYEVGADALPFVVRNTTPTPYMNIVGRSAYIDDTPLYGDECGLKVQPVSVYRINGKNQYSLTANFTDVTGGLNKPTFQIQMDRNEYSYSAQNIVNNLVTGEDKTPVDISYGNYYRVHRLYNSIDGETMGEFIEDCYTNDDVTLVGSKPVFFSDNNLYNKKYTVVAYNGRTRTATLQFSRQTVFLEVTNNMKFIETMYFNHFVTVYPIFNGKTDENNPTIETTTLYCDDLELSVFGDCVPYLVSYVRKGELKDNPQDENDIADLDCSVFARIMCYNKNTHLITVNNPIVFKDSVTPRHLVVAYQNTSPFNRPKEIIVTVDNEPLKKIVSDLSEPYNNGSCDIRIYTNHEYDNFVEDRAAAEEKDKRHKLVEKYMTTLNAKQVFLMNEEKLQKENNGIDVKYLVFGLYEPNVVNNLTISAVINGTSKDAVLSNGLFYFACFDTDGDGVVNPITSLQFTNGQNAILAVRFRETTLEGGNGLFKNGYFAIKNPLNTNNPHENHWYVFNNITNTYTLSNDTTVQPNVTYYGYSSGFGRLKVIDGLNFPTHTWESADFGSCGAVMSINASAFNFKITKPSDGTFGMLYLMSNLQNMESADITIEFDESLPQTVSMDLSSWFKNCKNIEHIRLNFKNRNVRVVCMDYTFQNCKRLRDLDLSGLDFSECKSAISAFDGCTRLENLTIDWGENTVFENANAMFRNCQNIKSFGSFDGWKYDGILMNRAFENCISVETLDVSCKTSEYSSDIFKNCGAETLSFKQPIHDYNLAMPNLKSFGTFGGFVSRSTFNLNTPNLTRSGWQKFISKFETTAQNTTINVHIDVFKRMLKNVDYYVENNRYYVTGRGDIRIVPKEF